MDIRGLSAGIITLPLPAPYGCGCGYGLPVNLRVRVWIVLTRSIPAQLPSLAGRGELEKEMKMKSGERYAYILGLVGGSDKQFSIIRPANRSVINYI